MNVATSLLLKEDSERLVFEHADAMLARDYALELVAHPNQDGEDYVLARGAAARSWIAGHSEDLGALPWVGVYRRMR